MVEARVCPMSIPLGSRDLLHIKHGWLLLPSDQLHSLFQVLPGLTQG